MKKGDLNKIQDFYKDLFDEVSNEELSDDLIELENEVDTNKQKIKELKSSLKPEELSSLVLKFQ